MAALIEGVDSSGKVWTAAGSEAPRRFRAQGFLFGLRSSARAKAPSPLRSAGALHDASHPAQLTTILQLQF
jgi:hypothetical protein